MLATNALIYLMTETDRLDKNVTAILQDYGNQFCISAETIREMIVGYRNKSFTTKLWKDCQSMVTDIEKVYNVRILPIDKKVMKTYATLTLNTNEGHKAPSDHIIISHAMTLGLPLISSDRRFAFYRKQGLDLIFNKK